LQLLIVAVRFIGFSVALILCTKIRVQANLPVTVCIMQQTERRRTDLVRSTNYNI